MSRPRCLSAAGLRRRGAPGAASRLARSRRWPRVAGLLVFGIASLRAPALAQPAAGEYDVKAVFLFHFTRFVEWPPAAFAASDAPFAVCVLGDDPFDGALEEVMRGETAAGRRVVVRQPTSLGEAGGCQLLFVSGVEAAAGLGDGSGLGATEDASRVRLRGYPRWPTRAGGAA